MNPTETSRAIRSKGKRVLISVWAVVLAFLAFSCGGGGGGGGGEINSPPSVTTNAATQVSFDNAVLNGTVDPHGLATDAWFEWGTDNTLSTFTTTAPLNLGGTGSIAINHPLSGLSYGTTYYFRVVAQNVDGKSEGTILSFTTLSPPAPTVTTDNATNITTNGARLNGTVNPNGFATDAWFEWGKDPSLSSFTETSHQSLGSGTASLPINEPVPAPWDTYYFRVVASNVGGTRKGSIKSFTTGHYYVAVGDSITLGSGDDIPDDDTSLDGRNSGGGYEPILNNLLTAARGFPHTVVNEGVSGRTSADGAAAIASTLAAHPNAGYVLILYGTNDAIIPALSKDVYKANMEAIILAVLAAGKTPYLSKVPFTGDPLRNISRIQEYNQAIDELVVLYGISVAPPNLYTDLVYPDEFYNTVHPNGAGYQSIAGLWSQVLTP